MRIISLLRIENVSFAYGKTQILKDINMHVEVGEFVSVLGQSGCGKSTLLRLIAGLNKGYTGDIFYKNTKIINPANDMSIVFQDYSLFPWMTVGRNILIALREKNKKASKTDLNEIIYKYLEAVGLKSEVYHKYPNELSGGMRQRCAICRALVLNADLMLMDEPFGALDAITRNNLQELMISLRKNPDLANQAVFFITHDVNEALYLSDRIYILKSSPGEVIYEISVEKDPNLSREFFFEDSKIDEQKHIIMDKLYDDIHAKKEGT